MNDISKNTLQKIKHHQIKPYPRRYFFYRRAIVWGVFGIFILLGSIASAVAIYQLKNAEWDLYQHLAHSLPEFVLLVMPYFWLVILLGFTVAAYHNFRQTRTGYRYRMVTVVLLSLLLSVAGGTTLFVAGFSEPLEAVFQENLPFYPGVASHRKKMWMRPRDGLLAGKIIKVLDRDTLRLLDHNGKLWIVDTTGAIWRGRLSPSENLEIKLIGKLKGGTHFSAREIRPWHGQGKRRHMRQARQGKS